MLGGIGMNNKAEYTPEKVVDISNLSREDWLEYRKKGNRSRTAGNQCSFCGTAGAGLQGSAGGRYEPLPYYL